MAAATTRLGAMTATIPRPAAIRPRATACRGSNPAALVRLAMRRSTTRKTAWMMNASAPSSRGASLRRDAVGIPQPPSTEEDIDDDFDDDEDA